MDWIEADREGIYVSWFPCDPAELNLPRLRFGPAIMHARRVALVVTSHPLAGRTEVDVEELADHAFMYPPNPPELGQRFARFAADLRAREGWLRPPPDVGG